MYDVVIVGAGVVGGMIARTLAAYQLRICIVEKENDVATGATKANSAIVHAGFDAKPGTLKAKLNVQGAKLMSKVAAELGVKYRNNGSLVIGFDEDDRATIKDLLNRGRQNGVANLQMLDKTELKRLEPNISDNAVCALYAPTAGIVCPYELTIAAIGNAMDNGADLKTNFEVLSIKKIDEYYEVASQNETIRSKIVINVAGVFSDKIAAMAGDQSFDITPRRGEYILIDKDCGNLVTHTIFRTPSKMGKGILVTPTVDGNLLLGPTSVDIQDRNNTATTNDGFAKIIKEANENVQGISFNKTITSFCGLRSTGSTGDFIINAPFKGFINVAGIESPGLSSAPAIALMVRDMLAEQGIELAEKQDYSPSRKSMHYFRDADMATKNEIIKKDKTYGRIICRCEGVTEGEILEAIRTNPKPTDLDGVKRRTRAQMGRCQGGFCTPYIIDLLAKELGVPREQITKKGAGSNLITGTTREEK